MPREMLTAANRQPRSTDQPRWAARVRRDARPTVVRPTRVDVGYLLPAATARARLCAAASRVESGARP